MCLIYFQSAESTLKQLCGEVNAKFIDNAPCGFLKYKYPKVVQETEQCDGAKVRALQVLKNKTTNKYINILQVALCNVQFTNLVAFVLRKFSGECNSP